MHFQLSYNIQKIREEKCEKSIRRVIQDRKIYLPIIILQNRRPLISIEHETNGVISKKKKQIFANSVRYIYESGDDGDKVIILFIIHNNKSNNKF